MGKLFTYVLIAVGLVILFNLAGLNTMSGNLVRIFAYNEIQNLQSSWFWLAIISALLLLGTIGGGIMVFGSGVRNPEIMITAFASLSFVVLIGDLVTVLQSIKAEGTWVGYIAYLIMLPFIAGFILALYDWVRGKG